MFAEALKKRDQELLKQGKIEGMKTAALNMLYEGMDINKISKITGITIGEIRKLKMKK